MTAGIDTRGILLLQGEEKWSSKVQGKVKLVGRFHLFLGWKEYLYGDGNGSVYRKKRMKQEQKGRITSVKSTRMLRGA